MADILKEEKLKLALREDRIAKEEQFIEDEKGRLAGKQQRLEEREKQLSLDLASLEAKRKILDKDTDDKLAGKTAILDEREEALAKQAQELNKKISEYSDEKNLFDATNAKLQSDKSYFAKFAEDGTNQLAEAHEEVNARSAELELKIAAQNKREYELDAREKLVEEKETEASAQTAKANKLLSGATAERIILKASGDTLDKLTSAIAADLQASAERLKKAQAIEAANNEKDVEFAKRETIIASNITELKKMKSDFFAEQKSIGNDNLVKSRLLDEKMKTAKSLQEDLERQKEELDLLKSETLKNL